MDDRTLQRKLNQMVRLGNELDAEAKRRWGQDGLLFHEADGGLVMMDILSEEAGSKSDHVMFAAKDMVLWGSGAF